jgi:hypothetical protein
MEATKGLSMKAQQLSWSLFICSLFHEMRRAMAKSPLFCCNFVHFVAWIFCLEIKIANTLQIKINISIVLIIQL